jgi:glycosyltransferase involved in cell wall biosynthesis
VEALIAGGYLVTVVGPTGYGAETRAETIRGVDVCRYHAPPAGRGFLAYVREYGLAMFHLRRLIGRVQAQRPVHVVFLCNPPDFLIALALSLVRRDAAIVFDNRELAPELFEVKFGRRGPLYRLLVLAERFAFRHSDAILVTNPSYVDNVVVRGGIERDRVFVVGNGPDPRRIFPVEPRVELRRGRAHLVLWIGAMSQQDGLEHVIGVADELVNRRGRDDVAFAVVGPGDIHELLGAQIRGRGLGDVVELRGLVGDDLVRAYIATADVCLGVDEQNSMNDRASMRKVLEYMTMGRPVVQFPLQEMRRICGDATVYAHNADPLDMADRIEELLDDPEGRRRLGARAQRRISDERLLWPDQVPSLLTAFDVAVKRRASVSDEKRSVHRRFSRPAEARGPARWS